MCSCVGTYTDPGNINRCLPLLLKIFPFCFLLTFAAGLKGERRTVTCHVTNVTLVLRVRRGQGGDIMKTINKCDTTWELFTSDATKPTVQWPLLTG